MSTNKTKTVSVLLSVTLLLVSGIFGGVAFTGSVAAADSTSITADNTTKDGVIGNEYNQTVTNDGVSLNTSETFKVVISNASEVDYSSSTAYINGINVTLQNVNLTSDGIEVTFASNESYSSATVNTNIENLVVNGNGTGTVSVFGKSDTFDYNQVHNSISYTTENGTADTQTAINTNTTLSYENNSGSLVTPAGGEFNNQSSVSVVVDSREKWVVESSKDNFTDDKTVKNMSPGVTYSFVGKLYELETVEVLVKNPDGSNASDGGTVTYESEYASSAANYTTESEIQDGVVSLEIPVGAYGYNLSASDSEGTYTAVKNKSFSNFSALSGTTIEFGSDLVIKSENDSAVSTTEVGFIGKLLGQESSPTISAETTDKKFTVSIEESSLVSEISSSAESGSFTPVVVMVDEKPVPVFVNEYTGSEFESYAVYHTDSDVVDVYVGNSSNESSIEVKPTDRLELDELVEIFGLFEGVERWL